MAAHRTDAAAVSLWIWRTRRDPGCVGEGDRGVQRMTLTEAQHEIARLEAENAVLREKLDTYGWAVSHA